MKNTGLARIVSQPRPREYHLAQFLGDEVPTVPPVLTSDLRQSLRKTAEAVRETKT